MQIQCTPLFVRCKCTRTETLRKRCAEVKCIIHRSSCCQWICVCVGVCMCGFVRSAFAYYRRYAIVAWQYFGFSVRNGSWFEQWFKHSKNSAQNRRKAHNKYGTINEYFSSKRNNKQNHRPFCNEIRIRAHVSMDCTMRAMAILNVKLNTWKSKRSKLSASIFFLFVIVWLDGEAVISAVRKWISKRFGCGWRI